MAVVVTLYYLNGPRDGDLEEWDDVEVLDEIRYFEVANHATHFRVGVYWRVGNLVLWAGLRNRNGHLPFDFD